MPLHAAAATFKPTFLLWYRAHQSPLWQLRHNKLHYLAAGAAAAAAAVAASCASSCLPSVLYQLYHLQQWHSQASKQGSRKSRCSFSQQHTPVQQSLQIMTTQTRPEQSRLRDQLKSSQHAAGLLAWNYMPRY
jgi:hypothetical protein